MGGDLRLSRHMVKGHLKTPNRTLPCNSVRQETRLSTSSRPQSHETRDLPGARSMHQPVRQKTTFVQRMAQSSSTALVDELPGKQSLPVSFLSSLSNRVPCLDQGDGPHAPGSLPHGGRVVWSQHGVNRWGTCLQRWQAVPAAQAAGWGAQRDVCGAAPLCSRDAPDPFTGTAQAPSSLLPASARRSVEPGMDDASHGPHVGKLETPHAPTAGPSGASL